MPGMPSVKNNSFLYPSEEQCMEALTNYLNIYESKPLEYKENLNFAMIYVTHQRCNQHAVFSNIQVS